MTNQEKIALVVDNTATIDNINDLGILKFGKMFFPERFDRDFSEVHYIMARLLFRILDPSKEYALDRQAYFLVHREAAKTTIGSFLFPAYMIYLKGHTMYVRSDLLGWDKAMEERYPQHMLSPGIVKIKIGENFILITSQTKLRAEGFVSSIKSVIENRQDLALVFGDKDPRVIEESEERKKSHKMWRINSFVTSDETIVWALGSGQHIRGINVNGYRPSMIIVDDIYSQENTKTIEAREKLNYWYDAELINSWDSRRGKVLTLGTLVHPETIFKDLKEDPKIEGVNRPIISKEELKKLIEMCSKTGEFIVPNHFECEKIDNELKTLSWRDHKGSYFILNKYKNALLKRKLDYFYQEFMNEPIAPETKMISPDAFRKLDLDLYIKNKVQMVEFDLWDRHWVGQCLLFAGLDPASSIVNTADDTAIVVAGFARCFPSAPGMDLYQAAKAYPKGKVFPIIVHIEGGKYSITDYQKMPGMAEALLRLDAKYKIERINAEANGQQEQIVRQISKVFSEPNEEAVAIRRRVLGKEEPRKTVIWNEFNLIRKEERILSILLPIVQQYKIVLCPKIPEITILYNQLLTVGFASHEDYPDAFATALKHVELPEIDDKFVAEKTGKVSKASTDTRKARLIEAYGADWWMYN